MTLAGWILLGIALMGISYKFASLLGKAFKKLADGGSVTACCDDDCCVCNNLGSENRVP